MPELPEVETVRRTLASCVAGRVVDRVRLNRPDVVREPMGPSRLLRGCRVAAVLRHGKQLAIIGDRPGGAGGCICVHLGMTGTLRFVDGAPRTGRHRLDQHVHVVWRFAGGGALLFRDPRRFGAVLAFDSREQLWERRWSGLGPDALHVTAAQVHRALAGTRRAVKAALLDQRLVAGLGNIYVDELLHACRWHPLRPSDGIAPREARAMIPRLRSLLGRAIDAGGSTLRDHADARGRGGLFQDKHRVYGRAGQPCKRCRGLLARLVVAGRTSTYCPACQPAVPPAG